MSIIKVNQNSKGLKPLMMVFLSFSLITISYNSLAFANIVSKLMNAGQAWKDTQLVLKRVSQPTIPATVVASAPATPRTLSASGLFQAMATQAVASTITHFLIDSPSEQTSPQSYEKSASLQLLNAPVQTLQYPSEYTQDEFEDYISSNPQDIYLDLQCGSATPIYTQVISLDQLPAFVMNCMPQANPDANNVTFNSQDFYFYGSSNLNNAFYRGLFRWTRDNGATDGVYCSMTLAQMFNAVGYTGSYTMNFCSSFIKARAYGFTDGVISFKVNQSYKFEPFPWEMDDETQSIQPNTDQIIWQSEDENGNPITTYINISGNLIEYDNQHLDLQTRVRTRNRLHVRASDGKIVNHDNEISQNSEIINYFKANDTFQTTGNDTSTQTEVEIKEETETKTQNLTAIDTEIQTLTQIKNELKTKLQDAITLDTYTDTETQQEYDFIGKIEQLFNEFQIQDPQLDLPELPNISLIPQFTPGDPVACEPIPLNYESTGITQYLNASASIDICDKLGLARDLLGYTFYLITLFFGWTSFYRQGRAS